MKWWTCWQSFCNKDFTRNRITRAIFPGRKFWKHPYFLICSVKEASLYTQVSSFCWHWKRSTSWNKAQLRKLQEWHCMLHPVSVTIHGCRLTEAWKWILVQQVANKCLNVRFYYLESVRWAGIEHNYYDLHSIYHWSCNNDFRIW
jgi:hypothetical protein